MLLFFYQPDAQIIYFNTFIMFLYTFRVLLCSSSERQFVLVQHLVGDRGSTVVTVLCYKSEGR